MSINFLENKGTINTLLHQTINVSAQPKFFENSSLNPNYRGESYLNSNEGTAKITFFSFNKITVEGEVKEEDILIINQNYYPNWYANEEEAISFNGLLATKVNKGKFKVDFEFKPKLFYYGLFVTMITSLLLVIVFIKFDSIERSIKQFFNKSSA